jgi:beta-aspartyl-peptidase (threonine type)
MIVKYSLLVFSFVASLMVTSVTFPSLVETETDSEIQQILTTQAACWNRGDIDGFMETYWKSEDLTFSGGGKTTRGWQATLDRYKKSYPKEKMGQLMFDGLEITSLSSESALVLGFWHLQMPTAEKGKTELKEGNFSLVLKKFDGDWKIIHDHSSTDDSNKKEKASASDTGSQKTQAIQENEGSK